MTTASGGKRDGRVVGRYVLFDELAAGGMATIHLGRVVGAGGFSRTIAIKRLHPHYAKDPEFRAMILDEARIVSRIQHTHVIPTIDVVVEEDDILLVMEYVHGEPVSKLLRAARRMEKRLPIHAVITIVSQALYGLHAAHEARDDRGNPLHVVHRDVSPQNILVGIDGVTRVLDFGVAKAVGRMQSTHDGSLKGKLPYMPPEQIRGLKVDRRTDVYAAAVVLWEMLVGRPLFRAENEAAILHLILDAQVPLPSSEVPIVGPHLDAIVMRGLARDPEQRYATALEMAEALQRVGVATGGEISDLVRQLGEKALEERGRRVAEIESQTLVRLVSPPIQPAAFTSSNDVPTAVRAAPAAPANIPLPSALEPTRIRRSTIETPRQIQWVVVSMSVVLLLGVVLGIGWWFGTRNVETKDAAPAKSPIPALAASTAIATAPTSAPVMAPAAAPIASSVPVASASAVSTAASRPKIPPKKYNCNPPYTIDEDGIRIPKPECL